MNYSTNGSTEENVTFSSTTTEILDQSEDATSQDPRIVASDNIWKVCSPILILLGTIGNSVSIAVLCRKSIWKISSSPYLVVLGVADLFVLWTGLLRQWLRFLVNIDIRDLSPVICKLQIFCLYTVTDFSAWTLVAVTVERFIFVCFPFKAKSVCTRRRTTFTLVLILIALALVNSHLLYGYDFVYDEPSVNDGDPPALIPYCGHINDDYSMFFDEIWPWLDISVFSLVPFSIIAICNISIITKIARSLFRNKVAANSAGEGDNRVKPSSMTALLLSLNTVFLVTTAPVCIYYIGLPEWTRTATSEEDMQLDLWFAIVHQLMYLNNSVNFLFYCISGQKFRRELRSMCGQRSATGTIATESFGRTGVSVIPLREHTNAG
ncbi:neuromedin-U receptor 2-like [Liolophura sinensis]|uniref:neuromedin-U receptor 2-like n=1 Tax=Liolophura sinensis TaxID=3198878 RepID=UPI0031597756